jgi:hypothetical protein
MEAGPKARLIIPQRTGTPKRQCLLDSTMRTNIKDRDQASKNKLAEMTRLYLRLLRLTPEKAGQAAEADLRDLKTYSLSVRTV